VEVKNGGHEMDGLIAMVLKILLFGFTDNRMQSHEHSIFAARLDLERLTENIALKLKATVLYVQNENTIERASVTDSLALHR